MNRCLNAAGTQGSRGIISDEAFYLRTSDYKCGCAIGSCSSQSGSTGDYISYRIIHSGELSGIF
jgi:hypothetical protein